MSIAFQRVEQTFSNVFLRILLISFTKPESAYRYAIRQLYTHYSEPDSKPKKSVQQKSGPIIAFRKTAFVSAIRSLHSTCYTVPVDHGGFFFFGYYFRTRFSRAVAKKLGFSTDLCTWGWRNGARSTGTRLSCTASRVRRTARCWFSPTWRPAPAATADCASCRWRTSPPAGCHAGSTGITNGGSLKNDRGVICSSRGRRPTMPPLPPSLSRTRQAGPFPKSSLASQHASIITFFLYIK